MNPAVAYSPGAYREASVLSAPPERLVVLLYDGARRFLHQAAVAKREGQIEVAHRKLCRAEDIIRYLRDTLDAEQGGELAERLGAIYEFSQRQLTQARFDRDAAKIEQVNDMLGRLRDAWAAVAGQ